MLIKIKEFLSRYSIFLAASILLLVALRRIIAYYLPTWGDEQGYYTHAPLVPLVVGYMVWKNQKKIGAVGMSSSWLGPVFAFAGMLLYIVASAIGYEIMCGPAIMLFIFGMSLTFIGKSATRVLILPLLFIYSMIPISPGFLDKPTAGMQLISSAVSAHILQLTGASVVRDGNLISSVSLPETLNVAGPCSGLKLLISMIMFSVFFAYITRSNWWKKSFLIALSFPLSIIMNSLRVVSIGYAGIWTYSSEITGKVHDYSAVPALIISFLILLGIAKLIGAKNYSDFAADQTTSPKTSPKTLGLNAVGMTTIIIILVTLFTATQISSVFDMPKGHIVREVLPRTFGAWTSQEIPVAADLIKVLNKSDMMQLLYDDISDSKPPILLFMASTLDPVSLHDPHACLPGNGDNITKEQIINMTMSNGTPPIRATLLQTIDETGTKGLVLYWYTIRNNTYPDTMRDMNKAYFKARLGDLGNMAMHPLSMAQIRQDIYTRQIVWYRFSMDGSGLADIEYLKGFVRDFMAAGK